MSEIENTTTVQVFNFTKDPTSLTKFLKTMLWISLGISVLSLLSDFMQMNLLSDSFSQAKAGFNDTRQQIIWVLYLVAFVVTGIAFLKWIYRANSNCRGFGAQGMKFTPGWSIGWYFIPIAALWKPYQAMKEIWKVSTNPINWQKEDGSSLLGWWWALWLIYSFLGQASLRLSMRANTISSLQTSTTVSIISEIIDIPLYIVAVSLISTIFKKQKKLVENNGSKKIGNKKKNNQGKALFPLNCQLKQDIASNTQNMIAKGRTTQLKKGIPSEHTIENKVISKEKSILEELRNEGILTAGEFIEKMAVVKAREEAERFEKLLCSITEPFINKISELKNAGLLNEQEYEQKKRKIIEKHRIDLLEEQEQKQKKRAMTKGLLSISEDDYRVMNTQAFDYLDIIDKKKKLGLINTQDEETNEIFRLQEIHQELIECNEICFKCYAFRKPSEEKCSACGQVFNKE